MSAPNKAERERCWAAKDTYWACLDSNDNSPSACEKLKVDFYKSCSKTWQNTQSNMTFRRIVSKGVPEYYYLSVELEFEEDPLDLTAVQFKAVILHAFALMFGELGRASAQIDILKYRPSKREACLRVDSKHFVKLWGALTLFGEYAGQKCAFRVHKAGGNLMGLAANSRTFVHKPVTTVTT